MSLTTTDKLAMIAEARLTFGQEAAQQMWRLLRLPMVDAMPKEQPAQARPLPPLSRGRGKPTNVVPLLPRSPRGGAA